MEHLHKCINCSRYTLEEKCPLCLEVAVIPKPPKFSLDDKYIVYRAQVKKEERVRKGLL